MVYFRHWLREVPAEAGPPEDGLRGSPPRDAERRGFGKSLQRPLRGRHLRRCAGHTNNPPVFSLLFVKKNHILACRAIQFAIIGENIVFLRSSQQLPVMDWLD